jgi:hypothetical protein
LSLQIRHGGPIQLRVALQDELTADILPPPMLWSSRTDTTLGTHDPSFGCRAGRGHRQAYTEFARRKYWQDALPARLRADRPHDQDRRRILGRAQQRFLPTARR